MKKISLTQGKVAMVDDCDFEWLSNWKWNLLKSPYTYYAVRGEYNDVLKKQKTIRMHRVILNAPKGIDVDHRNHNGLNNQRYNIRICTKSQNMANQRYQEGNSSEYKGVCWHNRGNKWVAYIGHDGKRIHLGSFVDEIDAAKAYDIEAKKLFGEFAYTNFFSGAKT